MPSSETIAYVLDAVGWPWQVALAGLFLVGVCEAARPKERGADAKWMLPFRILAAIAGIVTPLLLFFHAFWAIAGFEDVQFAAGQIVDVILARQVVIVALIIVMGAAIVLAWLIGWALGAMAPGLGRMLDRIGAPISALVLALAIFIAWRNAAVVIELFLQSRGLA